MQDEPRIIYRSQIDAANSPKEPRFRDPMADDPYFVAGAWGMLVVCTVLVGGMCYKGYQAMSAELRVALLQAAEVIHRLRSRKLKLLIDEELCRHGLSTDAIQRFLLGLDHFSFAMDGKVCTCVRREDGTYDFGFPTPQCVTEMQGDYSRIERMAAIANEGRAQGEAERKARIADGTAFEVGGSLVTVAGGQP